MHYGPKKVRKGFFWTSYPLSARILCSRPGSLQEKISSPLSAMPSEPLTDKKSDPSVLKNHKGVSF